ncbi:MAG: ATP-binding cassette domain-containing protein [Coriobacteriia bacterium]
MIEFSDVAFTYAGAASGRPAVDGLEFDVAPGELLVVLGANGSGKSTLALLANGLLLPNRGEVRIDGMPTTAPELVWDIRSRVGVVFQDPENQIVGTMVEEDVAFGPENLGVPHEELRQRVDRALAVVGLDGLERREPHTLSGGQKQRLAIAGVLALQPEYLVLDEPTAMLDPVGRADVLRVIARLRSEGRGIVHITHHLEDVAGADKVLVLASGRAVFQGSARGLFERDGGPAALGITIPPVHVMARELASAGVALPSVAVSADDIVGALWR